MAAKKAKNTKLKKHRGVTLIAPSEKHRTGWQARWKDPDTGKLKKEKLPERLTTAEARAEWCAAKLDEIKRRKFALSGGAVRAQGKPIADAIDLYFGANPQLDPRTRDMYRLATRRLIEWCAGVGEVRNCDGLTRQKLILWRAHLQTAPKLVPAAGEKPGQFKASAETLSASSINQALVATKTVLRQVVDFDVFPYLSFDDVRRALPKVREPEEPVYFLRGPECRQLLEAAIRHDTATFKLTTFEQRGFKAPGTTLRNPPFAPFVLFLLLTGLRIDEGCRLEWEHVDLSGGGELRLPAKVTKTRMGRQVPLEVSPSVRLLLAAMRPKNATGSVWNIVRSAHRYAVERLNNKYGAPPFTWHVLRATCGTFLTNAPGIYGGASTYHSAKRLGHAIAVAEKSYLGQVRGIPLEARTLEAAMGIEDLAEKIVAMAKP